MTFSLQKIFHNNFAYLISGNVIDNNLIELNSVLNEIRLKRILWNQKGYELTKKNTRQACKV